MPKLNTSTWQDFPGTVNKLIGSSNGPYSELVLGEQVKLSQFGVHLERLPPGSRSSFRHWHETEDELIYVLEGELVLVEDQESILRKGDAAAWKAGVSQAHCLENRSTRDATFLAVGTRAPSGVVHYPDHDIVMHHDEHGRRFFRGDGTTLPSA
jgi:uncharacterized cupin superfamily protein